MAEAPDQESKTGQPTEKKIRDSPDQGKIPLRQLVDARVDLEAKPS